MLVSIIPFYYRYKFYIPNIVHNIWFDVIAYIKYGSNVETVAFVMIDSPIEMWKTILLKLC